MNFKQQKTDLNAERKKNALLEQRLREMEAALATGGISSTPNKIPSIPSMDSARNVATPTKTITITTPAVSQAIVLAEETITQLILSPPHSDNSATAGSTTMSAVGRWNKCLLVAPLLQVDIGGVDELPLWRIFMDLMIKRMETEITKKKVQRDMVGPHMRQPIYDRILTKESPNITLTEQTTIMGIGATEINGSRPAIVMLAVEAVGRNQKLLAASGLSRNSLIPGSSILYGELAHPLLN
jgi:hypothetical protein